MASALQVSYYKDALVSIHVAKLRGVENIAKPVLMLAIFEGIADGSIIGNRIVYNDKLANDYKRIYLEFRKPPITLPVYPYYYLHSDTFYHVKGDTSRKTPSVKYLKENVEYAALDEELWDLLQDSAIREEYRQAIIRRFLQQPS